MLLLLLLALLLPPGAPEGEIRGGWDLAETWPGAPDGPLIPEDFELPAAPPGSGHVPAMLSSPSASHQNRSRLWSHGPPKSHRPAGTHGLYARAKGLLRQVDSATDGAKGPRGLWAVLLRLVGPAGSPGKCRPEERYQWFQKQHVDPVRPSTDATDYCKDKMADLRNTSPSKRCGRRRSQCKPINTFIHHTEEEIEDVCSGPGGKLVVHNIYSSTQTFQLTVCRRDCRAKSCTYTGERLQAWILLACEDNKPVHFEHQIKKPRAAHGPLQP